MKARTTLYDLLGLTPDATEAEIRAAHLLLVERYQSGKHGLPPVDADNRIKAIKEAYWILSEPGRRAAYDASLLQTSAAPPLPLADGGLPLKVEISDVKWTPGRIMLTIIGGLMIVGMVIQIFFSLFAFKQAGRAASGEMAAEAQERARRDEERRREEALRERTYYADRVSSDLERAEQAARQQAEREQRQKEEAERRVEMEEQRRVQERLSRERARWQQELRN